MATKVVSDSDDEMGVSNLFDSLEVIEGGPPNYGSSPEEKGNLRLSSVVRSNQSVEKSCIQINFPLSSSPFAEKMS